MNKIKDLTGQRFCKLIVKEYVGTNERNQSMWLCQCDCGNTKVVVGASMSYGSIKSCGCIRKSTYGLNAKECCEKLGISSTSFQEIKNRLGFKDAINKEQFNEIKNIVDDIVIRFGKVTLYAINRYWICVREKQ